MKKVKLAATATKAAKAAKTADTTASTKKVATKPATKASTKKVAAPAPALTAGSIFTIAAGTRVNRNGIQARQLQTRTVTLTKVEQTKSGKLRIYWVSTGKPASILV